MRLRSALAMASPAVLAACVPATAPRPAAPPPPPPASAPPQAPQPIDWQDWPVAPGDWTYARDTRSSIARFGPVGSVSAWVRCDLASHGIAVGRTAPDAGTTAMLTIRTSFGALQWPGHHVTNPVRGVEALRGAGDQGLDQIAFTRGRFTLELPDAAPMVLPGWAEPARVIEDCRG